MGIKVTDLAAHESVEKLYKAALNARQSMATSNERLRLRMEHYLEADCGCISALTGESISSVRDEVERRYRDADEAAWLKQEDHRPGEKADELDKILEGSFPKVAWDEIFSEVPDYPTDLPDDVVRRIADLAIHVRDLAGYLEKGLATGNRLTTLMGPSLISGSMKRITEFIESEIERGGF